MRRGDIEMKKIYKLFLLLPLMLVVSTNAVSDEFLMEYEGIRLYSTTVGGIDAIRYKVSKKVGEGYFLKRERMLKHNKLVRLIDLESCKTVIPEVMEDVAKLSVYELSYDVKELKDKVAVDGQFYITKKHKKNGKVNISLRISCGYTNGIQSIKIGATEKNHIVPSSLFEIPVDAARLIVNRNYGVSP